MEINRKNIEGMPEKTHIKHRVSKEERDAFKIHMQVAQADGAGNDTSVIADDTGSFVIGIIGTADPEAGVVCKLVMAGAFTGPDVVSAVSGLIKAAGDNITAMDRIVLHKVLDDYFESKKGDMKEALMEALIGSMFGGRDE